MVLKTYVAVFCTCKRYLPSWSVQAKTVVLVVATAIFLQLSFLFYKHNDAELVM